MQSTGPAEFHDSDQLKRTLQEYADWDLQDASGDVDSDEYTWLQWLQYIKHSIYHHMKLKHQTIKILQLPRNDWLKFITSNIYSNQIDNSFADFDLLITDAFSLINI